MAKTYGRTGMRSAQALAIVALGGLSAAGIGTLQQARALSADQVITKQYDDGGVYKGMFKDGLQDGQGSYTLPNGYSYNGQ